MKFSRNEISCSLLYPALEYKNVFAKIQFRDEKEEALPLKTNSDKLSYDSVPRSSSNLKMDKIFQPKINDSAKYIKLTHQ